MAGREAKEKLMEMNNIKEDKVMYQDSIFNDKINITRWLAKH